MKKIIYTTNQSPMYLVFFGALGISLLILITICGSGLGAYFSFKRLCDLPLHGVRVMGKVTGNDPESAPRANGSIPNGHYAIIAYTDLNGINHEIKRGVVNPISRLKLGEEVGVIYPINSPENGIVNSWDELYLNVYFSMVLFFGLFFFTFLWIAISALKRKVLLKQTVFEVDSGEN